MVSIIIPCYNGEKYIDRCLNSVLNQSYKDIEIILINDGSTDHSDNIIKKYLNDNRIKYFNRSNHGIGKTRNFGIAEATKEYITFLDIDDYLNEDAIKNMIDFALNNNLDMVISDYYVNNKYNAIKDFGMTSILDNPNLLLDVNLAPWNKLYKKDLIKNIKFIENLKYEDAPFVINALINAKKVGKLNYPTHYYVLNNNSETTIRDEKMLDIFKILDIIKKDLSEYSKLNDVYNNLAIRIICNYNIQQRYQKDKKMRHRFIDQGFDYMKNVDRKFKKNNYFKNRNYLKKIIEKNKMITKIYCDLYSFWH